MTPSAARGILESIYWKPEISWAIDRIHVLNPIQFTNLRRNELSGVISTKSPSVKRAIVDGFGQLGICVDYEGQRQQRAAMILRDVAYIIEANFKLTNPGDTNKRKHEEMSVRRVRAGQCFQRPYLGCREFPAFFELVEGGVPHSALPGEKDLGWMLHDIDYKHRMQARFFRALMKDGVICVPPFGSKELKA